MLVRNCCGAKVEIILNSCATSVVRDGFVTPQFLEEYCRCVSYFLYSQLDSLGVR